MLKYILVAIVVLVLWKLVRLYLRIVKNGGVPGMIARNTTALCAQIRKRRTSLDESQVRCLALHFNSANVRGKIPEETVFELVEANSGHAWEALCVDYVCAYMELVDGTDLRALPPASLMQHLANVQNQIQLASDEAEKDTNLHDRLWTILNFPETEEILARYRKFKLTRLLSRNP